MSLFFLTTEPINKTAQILDPDAHHIGRVLRHQIGDELKFATPSGQCYSGKISQIETKEVQLDNIKLISSPPPPFPIHLYVSLLQTEKMELIVQKAVELNIQSIQWMLCDRSQGSGIIASKWERLEKIALEAQKQCERVLKLEVKTPKKFSELLANSHHNIFCIERIKKSIPSPLVGEGQGEGRTATAVWVGPEGGWTENEILSAKEAGFNFCSLGPLVLRAETAAIAAIVLATSHYE